MIGVARAAVVSARGQDARNLAEQAGEILSVLFAQYRLRFQTRHLRHEQRPLEFR